MTKSKIVTIAKTGTNAWKDKTLTKWFVMFENGESGTLTTGFSDEPAPVQGDELEYTLEDKGFGTEVKLPKKAGSGFSGGGAKKWSAEQIAQQDAVKLTCAYLEQRSSVEDWKQFFIEAKQFMIAQIKADEGAPVTEQPAPVPQPESKLPF